MHTVYALQVSSLSFKPLPEVRGPAEADDSKIIMVVERMFDTGV